MVTDGRVLPCFHWLSGGYVTLEGNCQMLLYQIC
uniref:Uncharacterized protein n=1 Tax=Arundo donax TaxID=35708 RepID=A0A0A8Y159_ARUDO